MPDATQTYYLPHHAVVRLREELWLVFSRCRTHQFAFSTDIVKMFRQIRRADPLEDIRDFRLLTVTYGTTSAPYLALRTLLQLADDEEHRYPLDSRTIRENAYVDDILSGGDAIRRSLGSQDADGSPVSGGRIRAEQVGWIT